jgi:NTP pyrophosphatase (non-canonical NTP hydrolase)
MRGEILARRSYFAPLPMLARLTEEVGELARVLMHLHGGKKPKPGEPAGDVGEEIADAMFVLICLANSLGIDLDASFAAMMDKYRKRDAERWTRKGEGREGRGQSAEGR